MLRKAMIVAMVGVLALSGCSSNQDSSSSDGASSDSGDSDEEARTTMNSDAWKDWPAATIGDELTGGNGIALASAGGGPDLAKSGYSEAEYSASGKAFSFAGATPTNGKYRLSEKDTASFATRIIVRRPAQPDDYSGTTVVEWLNVSSGADAAPDYTYMAEEIVRQGHAWVGVSAQRIGIDGGPIAVEAPGAALGAGKGLANFAPERYGSLSHPGDAYSYDMFSRIGRALRDPDAKGNPLADLDTTTLLAVGESQSGFTLTTYADGIQPKAHIFDGILIHSRGGAPAPLGEPGEGIDIAGSLGGKPTTIRTDTEVPVFTVQTESDVLGLLGSYPIRQPDTDMIRLWEIAGNAHADRFQLGMIDDLMDCGAPINDGQQVFVLRAALRHLVHWAQGGDPPPTAELLAVNDSGADPTYVTDDVGNVERGVRTPVVDAPVAVLSGLPAPNSNIICSLMGTTTPIPRAALARRYSDRADYLESYLEATDAGISGGYLLEDDRQAIEDWAQPDRVPEN